MLIRRCEFRDSGRFLCRAQLEVGRQSEIQKTKSDLNWKLIYVKFEEQQE